MMPPNHQDAPATGGSALEADLSVALNFIVRDSLKPIATGLSVLLIVLAIASVLFSPREGATLLVAVNAVAAIGMFGFRMALVRWAIPYRWANPIGAMLAVLVLLICLFVMRFMPESQHSINLLLLVIGTGFVSLSAHWFLAMGLAVCAGGGLMASTSPPAAEWLHFGFALFCAAVLSLVIHNIRVRTLARFEKLRLHDQKQADELNNAVAALRESEVRYRHLVERSPDAIIIHQNGKFIYANPASATLFGIKDTAQLVGTEIMNFVPPAERERVLQRLQLLASTNTPTPVIEMKAMRADGRLIDVESRGIPFTHNNQPAVQTIIRDISRRKQDEEGQRERERLQLIFETSPIPMVITRRADSTVLYANQQFSRIFDLPRPEVIGRRAIDFYADSNDREVILAQLQTDGYLDGYELKAKSTSNRPFWMLLSMRPISFDAEPALLASFIDITEQKFSQEIRERYTHMQAALVQANKSLVSTLELDDLLVKILEAAHEALPAMEKGTILLWDEGAQMLRMKSVYGYQDQRVTQAFFSNAEGFAHRVALERQPLVIKDVREHAELQYHGDIEEMRAIESAVVAPLIVQDRLLGVISLDSTRPRAFTEDDLTLLVTFASQATLAIDNARLYEQVRLSEERYRALYEDNPSMYFTVDPNGKVLSVNRYGAEQLGYAVDELLGQSVLQVFYEEDKPRVLVQMQHCLNNRGQLQYWELRKVRKNGSVLWVGENARAVQDRDGNIVVLIVCEDITERKKIEQEIRKFNEELEQRVHSRTKELRESEAKFRSLAETTTAGIFIFQDDCMKYVNKQVERACGYSQEEFARMHFWDIVHPDFKEASYRRGMALLRGEPGDQQYEIKIVTRTGKEHWINFTTIQIEFEGRPAILGTAYDITERKEAEAKLHESEERFRQLAENIADVFWLDTGDLQHTLYVSPAYEKIWGRTCQSLLQNPATWRWAIHPEDREEAFASMHRWIQAGKNETYSSEYRIVRPDGGWRWISNRAFPIRNDKGEIYRIAGIAEDITERKALEEQLRQYTSALKLLVDERTERIRELEKQHIESEKLAATGRMAARIAHEINNPLGFIRTAFRLVSRSIPEQDRHYHYVHTIEKEIERIAKIVHQMLDLHRPYQEALKKFRLEETITEILALLKSESHERQVSFELDAERARDFITLPENMLRQILYNLVLNAVEASPPDGVVRIAAEIAGRQLQITVADQGAGISEETGARIFEPFFTTKSQSTTGGMGLGLSICKSLVEAMRGTITFEAKPHAGTIFKITIALNNDNTKGANHVESR